MAQKHSTRLMAMLTLLCIRSNPTRIHSFYECINSVEHIPWNRETSSLLLEVASVRLTKLNVIQRCSVSSYACKVAAPNHSNKYSDKTKVHSNMHTHNINQKSTRVTFSRCVE